MERDEYRQYVETLARLIETRQRPDEAGQREAERVINQMRSHVLASFDDIVWTAMEGDALDTLAQQRAN